MLRYLAGLLLVQLVTVGLFALNAGAEPTALALRAGLPAFAIALLAALWFRALSRVDGERDLARTRLEHERERERVARDAERERADLTLAAARDRAEMAREAERTVRREERRSGRRANLKVGAAFTAMGGMGVLFVLTELLTLGLLTLTAGGGALGGYLMRWRQTRPLPREVPLPERAAEGGGTPAAASPPREPPRLVSRRPDVALVPVWIDNLNRVLPKGESVPIPLVCTVTFGEATRLEPEESKDAFLARAAEALLALAPGRVSDDASNGTSGSTSGERSR